MGRPRAYDEAQVVDAARRAFWQCGVEATSVSDLVQVTGLSTSSLYAAFGSKAGLATRALQDYLDAGYAGIRSAVDEAGSGLAGLQAWLDLSTGLATSTDPAPGCYAVVCATELAAKDDGVREQLRRHDARLRALVAGAVRRAVADGDLRADLDPAAAAAFLCTAVNGLMVEARKGVTAARARSTLELALRALR
jgi:TetR/AcrR family transcriptional regulator, transcriptional repressor for nem operon